jgi:hypothetical protein
MQQIIRYGAAPPAKEGEHFQRPAACGDVLVGEGGGAFVAFPPTPGEPFAVRVNIAKIGVDEAVEIIVRYVLVPSVTTATPAPPG